MSRFVMALLIMAMTICPNVSECADLDGIEIIDTVKYYMGVSSETRVASIKRDWGVSREYKYTTFIDYEIWTPNGDYKIEKCLETVFITERTCDICGDTWIYKKNITDHGNKTFTIRTNESNAESYGFNICPKCDERIRKGLFILNYGKYIKDGE